MRIETKRLLLVGLAVALVAVIGLGAAAWWAKDLKYRPKVLDQHADEIASMLEQAGWVSPGVEGGRVLYLVGFRSCPDCIRYETEEFPKLQAAGVDTRVILYSPRTLTSPEDRTGVAALWAERDWAIWERWSAQPPAVWKAEGLPPADGDPARETLIAKGRYLVDALTPLLADNEIRMATPLLVWRDEDGRLRGCACESPKTYAFVRRSLGIS